MDSREDIRSKTTETREQEIQAIVPVDTSISSSLTLQDIELDLLFKTQLETVNGECYILDNSSNVDSEIEVLLKDNNALDKVLINAEVIKQFPELSKYSNCGPHNALVGISACELLVAQTGTTIVTATEGRQILGLSPIHIILAKKTQLRATLEQSMDELAEKYGTNFPSQLTLVTGPKRTADIEKTLILGAYGHKRLILMIY